MLNILSEGRKIEPRRQLNLAIALKIEMQRKNWKRYKRWPVNDHIDVRAGAWKGPDPKLLSGTKKRLDSKDVD